MLFFYSNYFSEGSKQESSFSFLPTDPVIPFPSFGETQEVGSSFSATAMKPGSEKVILDVPNILGLKSKKRVRSEETCPIIKKAKMSEIEEIKEEARQWAEGINPDKKEKVLNSIMEFLDNEEKRSLNLHNCKIDVFPHFLTRKILADRLIDLDLSGNNLTSLPASIGQLSMLKVLTLHFNRLTELPKEIGLLRNLNSLDLMCNRLKTLPPQIGSLFQLEYLNIGGLGIVAGESEGIRRNDVDTLLYDAREILEENDNQLQDLPHEIFHLVNLKDLDISYNQLSELSLSIRNLKMLENLDVSGNDLDEFPLAICHLTQLSSLYITRNDIPRIPAEIAKLKHLRALHADNNPFCNNALPPELGQLELLEILDLGADRGDLSFIVEIPEKLSNLSNLIKLNLKNNELVNVPSFFGKLCSLEELNLSCNEIRSLPEEMIQLQNLEILDVSFNSLEEIPNSLLGISSLLQLSLEVNNLTHLPDELFRLINLRHLILFGNESLNGLPEGITRLSRQCLIELGDLSEPESCSLSRAVLSRLEETINQPGYEGPSFRYYRGNPLLQQPKSLQTLLGELENIVNRAGIAEGMLAFIARESEENQMSLRMWLSRLDAMRDYKSAKEWLVNNVLKYLNLSITDPNFKESFYATIKGAETTCGDRMALSIMHLGIAYQLEQPMEIFHLAEFLRRGVFAMSLLEECARNKIPSLRFVDEIEVYLGYPLRLKNALGLPIEVKDMLYFRCSSLTREDLETARVSVLNTINNEDSFHVFLITQDKWKKALSKKCPEEYQAILDANEKALDEEEVNYEAVAKVLNEQLIALTAKVLSRNASYASL